MGGRAQKGERFGGRVKGTPNKRTTERLEKERIAKQAQQEVDKANLSKIKLGKEVLEDYMGAFHNIAAYYQNRIAASYAAGRDPDKADMAAFEKWGTLTATTARQLADFQSPKFKAIAIVAPPPNNNPGPPIPDNPKTIKDATQLQRIYQTMIKKPA